jgi:hypothetical protein
LTFGTETAKMSPDSNRSVLDPRASPGVATVFHLDCPCGNRSPVTEGQAGLRLTCSCGRTLQVPNLPELRRQAGLAPFPIPTATQVEERVKAGELPAGTVCARCARPTSAVLHAVAECESVCITTEEWSVNEIVVSEREVSQQGREVVVPVPLRLCPDCQRAFVRPSLGGAARLIAVPLAILGVGLLVLLRDTALWIVGLVPLALAGLLYLAPFWFEHRRQQTLKRLLRQTPLYDELLAQYPDTIVHVAEGDAS